MGRQYFASETMTFLRKLARHNQRDWFMQNKETYERVVREPALDLITDLADDLAVLSPHFLAQAKKVGGSLMRVHRDVRFSRNKLPYKTNIGIQFRHERGKDVYAPGFYIHIEPDNCFLGVGIWHPDALSLSKVRDMLVEQGYQWQAAISGKPFKRYFRLSGESLRRPPRGYAKDQPLIEDLKRKDFIAICDLEDAKVSSPRFAQLTINRFRAAEAFMQFLCCALDLQY